MAKEKAVNENLVKISFPFNGWRTNTSYEKQEPLTSPLIKNCRMRDIDQNRARGGQRPGMIKTATDPIGALPVQEMVQIVSTYIPVQT